MNRLRGFKQTKRATDYQKQRDNRDLYLWGKERSLIADGPTDNIIGYKIFIGISIDLNNNRLPVIYQSKTGI